jgi:uncharacterized protein YuzE
MESQKDGRIRHWGYVKELSSYLRVVTLSDGEMDSLYIELSSKPSADSKEVAKGLVLDFDAEGKIVGLDINNASKVIDLDKVETISLPTKKLKVFESPRVSADLFIFELGELMPLVGWSF